MCSRLVKSVATDSTLFCSPFTNVEILRKRFCRVSNMNSLYILGNMLCILNPASPNHVLSPYTSSAPHLRTLPSISRTLLSRTWYFLAFLHRFIAGQECPPWLADFLKRVLSQQYHALHPTCFSVQVSSMTLKSDSKSVHPLNSIPLKTGRSSICQWPQNLHHSIM